MSTEPAEKNGEAAVVGCLQERALADHLALKDRALNVAAEGITIADARLLDQPLIYANEGFERVTGYSVAEVLGRNCRFLQGPGTDRAAVAEIRAAVAEQRECGWGWTSWGDMVLDWSGGHLRDDVSLLAIERMA